MKIIKTTSVATADDLALIEQLLASGHLYIASYIDGRPVYAPTPRDEAEAGGFEDIAKLLMAKLSKPKGSA